MIVEFGMDTSFEMIVDIRGLVTDRTLRRNCRAEQLTNKRDTWTCNVPAADDKAT